MGNIVQALPSAVQRVTQQNAPAAQQAAPAVQQAAQQLPQQNPQALAQGLQQQAALQQAAGQLGKGGRAMPSPQGQIPMSMQRQPQGGLAGRTMTPQVQNAARAVMGSFRRY